MSNKINQLWTFLATGLELDSAARVRGPAIPVGDAPAWALEMFGSSDKEYSAYCVEQAVQLVRGSRFGNRLDSLDPLNTYQQPFEYAEASTTLTTLAGTGSATVLGLPRFAKWVSKAGMLAVDMDAQVGVFQAGSYVMTDGVLTLDDALVLRLEGSGKTVFNLEAVRRPIFDIAAAAKLIPAGVSWLSDYSDHAGYHRPDLSLAAFILNQFEASLA